MCCARTESLTSVATVNTAMGRSEQLSFVANSGHCLTKVLGLALSDKLHMHVSVTAILTLTLLIFLSILKDYFLVTYIISIFHLIECKRELIISFIPHVKSMLQMQICCR